MRKLTAILLLGILLFNIYGYQLVIFSLQANNATELEKKLDENQFTDAQLISVKTKLHLPYYQSSETFERAYGSINIDGRDYEFVKRRVYNDTLELLCLPDKKKTELNNVKNEIAKSSGEHQSNSPIKKGISTFKFNLSEYLPTETTSFVFENFSTNLLYGIINQSGVPSDYHNDLERPPQSAQVSSPFFFS